jgi:hypothetical protein
MPAREEIIKKIKGIKYNWEKDHTCYCHLYSGSYLMLKSRSYNKYPFIHSFIYLFMLFNSVYVFTQAYEYAMKCTELVDVREDGKALLKVQ